MAIEELARFTRSPRHYRVLKKGDFNVVCLKAAAHPFDVPESETEWVSILENALQTTSPGYERNGESGRCIRQAVEGHQRQARSGIPVDCECRLLQHFSTKEFAFPNARPMSYIGVSKLSCPACAAVFDAFYLGPKFNLVFNVNSFL